MSQTKISEPTVSENVIFVVLAGLGAALMTNVGGVLYGYGLIYAVMLFAVWQFKPKTAALLVLGAEIIALAFCLVSSSLFLSVAIVNMIIRPSVTYFASWVNGRRGRFAGLVTLTLVETLIALSIDMLVFGSYEATFAIYGIFLAPFVYVLARFRRNSGSSKVLGIVGAVVSLLAYYFSVYAFAAIITGLASLLSLVLLFLASKKGAPSIRAKLFSIFAIVIVVLGFALGGTQLQNNMKVSLYALNPHSWSANTRWEQMNPSFCPATNNVFASTYSASRLRIVDSCTTVVGVVGEQINAEADGDYTFNLSVNKTYANTLSIHEGNELHVEIVPADQHRELDPLGGGLCPGDVVRITGVLVIDTDHGMGSEIHPGINIVRIQNASSIAWPMCILGRGGIAP